MTPRCALLTPLLLCALLLCQSGTSRASHPTTPPLAQQLSNPQATQAASQAFDQGMALIQQDTAASLQRALIKLVEARQLWHMAGDRLKEGTTLAWIGYVYNSLGKPSKALEFYQQALSILREVRNRSMEGTTLNNIGTVYFNLQQYLKALDQFQQALIIHREVGNSSEEGGTLTNIGLVYFKLGQYPKALDQFQQALAIYREVGNHAVEGTILHSIGSVYLRQGQYPKALDQFQQALAIYREVGDRSGEDTTLHSIGTVYLNLGQYPKALDQFQQAIAIHREVGDSPEERLRQFTEKGTTLHNIGTVYLNLGQYPRALDQFQQAIAIHRKVGNRAGEGTTLHNIGSVYLGQGQYPKALDQFQQALAISREVGDLPGEGNILHSIGVVRARDRQYPKALDHYQQALAISREVGDLPGEGNILSSIAYVHYAQSNLQAALSHVEQAIAIIEQQRASLPSLEQRTAYFATQQDPFALYINVLMALHRQTPNQGYDAQAFHVNERARSRSFSELLTEGNADIRRGIAPELLAREKELQQQQRAVATTLTKLSSTKETPQAAIDDLRQQLTELERAQNQLREEIQAKSPAYAALQYPDPMTVADLQKQLDDNTLVLQYALGEERSYLWAITKTGMTSYELPKREDIEQVAQLFYTTITDAGLANLKDNAVTTPNAKGNTIAGTAQTLSQMVLAPVADQLGQRRLVIVGDGSLRLIPFAALTKPVTIPTIPTTDGYVPLVRDHEVVNLPSASTIGILRETVLKGRRPAAKALAVVADPVFSPDDERLTGKPKPHHEDLDLTAQIQRSARDRSCLGKLERLPGAAPEAMGIAKLLPASEVLLKLGLEASYDLLTSPELRHYRTLHLATHACFDEKNPELSGIALSWFDAQGNPQPGYLMVADLFNLDLPAELAVLSACSTGKGKEIRKGEGLVGITRGLMYAGVPRLVVSLWNVEDGATSTLMQVFYQDLLSQGNSPAAALRAVQKRAWQQGGNPHHWAAFTFQGEWR